MLKLKTKWVLCMTVMVVFMTACQSGEQANTQDLSLHDAVNVEDTVLNEYVHSFSNTTELKIQRKTKVERWVQNPLVAFKGSTYSHPNQAIAAAQKGDTVYLPRGIYTKPLVMRGVDNLCIVAADGPAYFLVPDHEVEVLTLDSCQNVSLENIYFKHDVLYGTCKDASTAKLKSCENIRFQRCLLNGSGVYGLNIENSIGIEVDNCAIENCSNHAIRIQESKRVRFTNNFIQSINLLTMDERTANPMSFYTESLPNRGYVENQLMKANEFHVVFYGNNMRFSGRYLNHQLRSKEPLKLRGTHFVEYNVVAAYGRIVSQKQLSETNQVLHNNVADTFKPYWPCNWHPGATFMLGRGDQLINSPVLPEDAGATNMLLLWKEKPSLPLLFPGDYFSDDLAAKNIDGTTKMIVTDNEIKQSKLRFFKSGEVEDIGGEMLCRNTLAAKDSCFFIIDSDRIEPAPLPEITWQPGNELHRIVLGDYACTLKTVSNEVISYVLLEDDGGERLLAYRNQGIMGEYGPYGRVTLIWAGDINRDGKPDFLCHYVATYCEYAHLLFLSNNSSDTGYEVNYYPDMMNEPCGC